MHGRLWMEVVKGQDLKVEDLGKKKSDTHLIVFVNYPSTLLLHNFTKHTVITLGLFSLFIRKNKHVSFPKNSTPSTMEQESNQE